MDEPSKSKGARESGQEISRTSQDGPQGIDLYQKIEEISEGDLGKQDEKEDEGD